MSIGIAFNWICQLGFISYIIYSFVVAFVYLISDIRHPFLGTSSSYLVTYLMVCALPLIVILFWKCYTYCFFSIAMILYISMLIAAFESTIFLTKKFFWTNPKREALLNAGLHIVMGILVFIAIYIFKKYENTLVYEFSSWQEFLWCGFSLCQLPVYTREILFFFRLIPCIPLFFLWTYSISKKYDALEKSFFEKAFNKPILMFLGYTTILATALLLNMTPLCQVAYAIIVLYLKLTFMKSLLHLLEKRTMEKIEVQYTMEVSKC